MTLWAQWGGVSSLKSLPLGIRLANTVVSYMRYIGKTFWPNNLALFYPYQTWPSWAVLGAGTILVAITGGVLWKAKRAPHFVVGWLWYLGVLVPVIGLVQVGDQSMADRYSYLPLVGLFMMVAWSLPSSLVERPVPKVIAAASAAVLLGVCAVLCRIQISYWRNAQTVFRHSLEVTRANWLAHNNLGKALLDVGDVQEAIGHFEQALRIKPDYAVAHDNLGSALAREGRLQEAVEQFDLALHIQRDLSDARYNMGRALLQMGKLPEAIEHYEQALQLNPNDAEAHFDLGNALAALGKMPEAVQHWTQAVQINPNYAEARNNLGAVLAQAGRFPEAIEQLEQVLRITPNDVEVHCNLGNALVVSGRPREAIQHYEQALHIEPDYPAAQNNLARLLATLAPAEGGDPVRAVALAQRLCERTSNRVAAYLDTLGLAYASVGRFNDAIASAQKAIQLARSTGQQQAVSEIEAHLQLYRNGQAYRQPIHATSPPNQ